MRRRKSRVVAALASAAGLALAVLATAGGAGFVQVDRDPPTAMVNQSIWIVKPTALDKPAFQQLREHLRVWQVDGLQSDSELAKITSSMEVDSKGSVDVPPQYVVLEGDAGAAAIRDLLDLVKSGDVIFDMSSTTELEVGGTITSLISGNFDDPSQDADGKGGLTAEQRLALPDPEWRMYTYIEGAEGYGKAPSIRLLHAAVADNGTGPASSVVAANYAGDGRVVIAAGALPALTDVILTDSKGCLVVTYSIDYRD